LKKSTLGSGTMDRLQALAPQSCSSTAAVAASLLLSLGSLTACGGGELAILGYIGAAGGSYVIDATPATAAVDEQLCGASDSSLSIVPDPSVDFFNYYASSYAITANGNLGSGNCSNRAGTVNGAAVSIPGCFTGSFRNVNELLSSDGQTLLRYSGFNFNSTRLTEGVWTDLARENYRIKLSGQTVGSTSGTATGCALNGSASEAVSVTFTTADNNSPSTGRLASVDTVTIGGLSWSAEMVGVSGLRLTRGGTVMQLARRTGSDTCPTL